jgi:transcription antitermination factor NusG
VRVLCKAHLEGQGLSGVFAKAAENHRTFPQNGKVEAAFFPRYLFVELDLTRHLWRSINGTFGVASLVIWGDLPPRMPRAKVRLAAGPFAEQLAIVDRLDDSGRVRVLLEILGRPVPVEIGREFVLSVI